jgi:hypothetical protein
MTGAGCERRWRRGSVQEQLEQIESRNHTHAVDKRGAHCAVGNPAGNRHHTRHLLNQEFIQALLLHFREHGKKAIEKVAREQPASYLKILALLVPREMKFERSQSLKSMSDEQLGQAIAAVRQMLDDRAAASGVVIEGTVETVALPAPSELEQPKRKPNRLMMEADTAIGPRERRPRKQKVTGVPTPAT